MNARWSGRVSACGCKGEKAAVMRAEVDLLLGLRVGFNTIKITLDSRGFVEALPVTLKYTLRGMFAHTNLKMGNLNSLMSQNAASS